VKKSSTFGTAGQGTDVEQLAGQSYNWDITGPQLQGTDVEQLAGQSYKWDITGPQLARSTVKHNLYLFAIGGTTSTNQNSIQEEVKSRLKSRNACYYSVQNLLSSRLLSKNLKIRIYKNIIFARRSVWV
jgi:hypothetical protein